MRVFSQRQLAVAGGASQSVGTAMARVILLLVTALLASACITLVDEHAVILDGNGQPRRAPLACNGNGAHALPAVVPAALDPDAIRLITWNIHKNGDRGWDRDLSRFAADHAIVLLQEARVNPALRGILERAGHRWVLANAFLMNERDTGVMSAARVAPLSACTLRQTEPILGLPKTALITRYALAGRTQTLVVANMHSINISQALGAYSAQIDAVARELQSHHGPLILAGDLNTWTAGRRQYVESVAASLGLRQVRLDTDLRSRFWGQQVDHILVRGIDVVDAEAIEVDSSDHNPVRVLLRVVPAVP